MNIIKHSNSSRLGHDVMINTDIALVGSLGTYFVVKVTNVRGYVDSKDIITTELTTDYENALKDYYRLGGKKE